MKLRGLWMAMVILVTSGLLALSDVGGEDNSPVPMDISLLLELSPLTAASFDEAMPADIAQISDGCANPDVFTEPPTIDPGFDPVEAQSESCGCCWLTCDTTGEVAQKVYIQCAFPNRVSPDPPPPGTRYCYVEIQPTYDLLKMGCNPLGTPCPNTPCTVACPGRRFCCPCDSDNPLNCEVIGHCDCPNVCPSLFPRCFYFGCWCTVPY